MSRKEQKVKLNSPKVNSELLTTLSSFTNPINQTTLSSNSKESKIQQNNSHLKCTCNHKMAKTFQKTQLKCTCKVYKNTNTNNMGSYKTESRESRFDQITTPVKNNKTNINTGISEQNSFRSQSYKKDTFMSASNDSRLVCTCKHLKNSNANIRRVYSEKKMGLYLWGQKTENLQILSSPAPELTTQYVQNLAIIQNSKPINILVPAIKNEIAYTNKIQIEGLSKEEAKEISEEKKEEEVKVETEKIEEKNEQEAKEEENEQEEKEEKEEEEEKEEKEEKEESTSTNMTEQDLMFDIMGGEEGGYQPNTDIYAVPVTITVGGDVYDLEQFIAEINNLDKRALLLGYSWGEFREVVRRDADGNIISSESSTSSEGVSTDELSDANLEVVTRKSLTVRLEIYMCDTSDVATATDAETTEE